MNTKEILVLIEKRNQYFLKYVNDNIKPIFKIRKGIINKYIFKLLFKINSKLLFIFFEDWKYSIKNYKMVILFDSDYRKGISRYIKKKNSNCRIILYYWNIIDENNKEIE